VREAFLDRFAPTGRNIVEYLPDPDGLAKAADTFLLANNPVRPGVGVTGG
jgi:hypothetical protein